jgi:hypothetical protein
VVSIGSGGGLVLCAVFVGLAVSGCVNGMVDDGGSRWTDVDAHDDRINVKAQEATRFGTDGSFDTPRPFIDYSSKQTPFNSSISSR